MNNIHEITAIAPEGLQGIPMEELQFACSTLTQLIGMAELHGNKRLVDAYCALKRDLNKELGKRIELSGGGK